MKFLQSEATESESSSWFLKDVGWWWSGPTTTSRSLFILRFLRSEAIEFESSSGFLKGVVNFKYDIDCE